MITNLPVSIIICVKNGEATLEGCLESVTNNNPAEIIIMDGNSTDRTVEIAQRYTGKIYVSDRGLAYRFQLGTELATEDYVAYVDSDVIVPKGTLEVMLAELTAAGYVGIHAQILATSISNYWERARQQDLHLEYNHPGERLKPIPTMTALWKRDIVLKYKFDPFFTGAYVDGDISYKVTAAGHKLGCSQAAIYHHHRSSLTAFIRQRYWHGQGGARFVWKHKSFVNLAGLICPIGPLHLGRCVLNKKPQLIPYLVVCDASHWAGMVAEFLRLLRKRLSSGRLPMETEIK